LALRQNGRFDIACQWYLDFTPLPYQYAWHQALVPNTTLLAGIAAGKTRIAAASYLIDCVSIPYFRALNTSVSANQAQLTFNMVAEWLEVQDNIKHHIEDIKLRPWPIITFRNYSEWEFRTAGQGAQLIRGKEYDRENLDEFGLSQDDDAIKVLRGRLRGIRATKTPRMG
jgi:hypothetical protein